METTVNMDWDLTSYFPVFDGKEMRNFKADLSKELQEIKATASGLETIDEESFEAWEAVVVGLEKISARYSHLTSFVGCLASADSSNEAYQGEEAALDLVGAEISKLQIEILRALKVADPRDMDRFCLRPALEGAEFAIRRLREKAEKQMGAPEEALAADLGVDGIHAWGRLYNAMAGNLEFEMVYPDGDKKLLSMSQRRSLLGHPDQLIRKAAFHGGNAAWEKYEIPAAAALNAIGGVRHTLNKRRGVDHFLDVARFQAATTGKTLDAMMEAVKESLDIPRRVLAHKAEKMGQAGIGYFDLEAPLPGGEAESASIDWETGRGWVESAFSLAYPRLGEFFSDICRKRWIDYTPRRSKRPGGFCTTSRWHGESRIFMTFNGTAGDVMTLAHEAGHAFHSFLLRSHRGLARSYPMTLAEAASTFGEMILVDGIVSDEAISDAVKIQMLDSQVRHSIAFLLDIPVRFEFEKRFYEERVRGEVSVSRLKSLMVETQREFFGDILLPGEEDPCFWASKLHFYISDLTFYNFPYTFGYLLSRGLFLRFKEEGVGFLSRYESFLKHTGTKTCEAVARDILGEDLQSKAFWKRAIRSLEGQVEVLDRLID